jgi:hypothetical protein
VNGGSNEKGRSNVLRHKYERDFTIVDNQAVRDNRLRWADRGLLLFLWHLPKDWRFNYAHLETCAPDGRSALKSCVRRLQQLGYLSITIERDGAGRFRSSIWEISDTTSGPPSETPASPRVENRHTGDASRPHADRPHVENQHLPSTEYDKELSQPTTTVVVVGLDEPEVERHRDAIVRHLSSCPAGTQQGVLDEAIGIIRQGHLRKDPSSLVRGLVKRVHSGEFNAAAGIAVAAGRQREQERREQEKARRLEEARRNTPEAREASRRARDAAMAKRSRPTSNSQTLGG